MYTKIGSFNAKARLSAPSQEAFAAIEAMRRIHKIRGISGEMIIDWIRRRR